MHSAAVVGADLARQDYILNCQGCHLADGSGAPGKVPRMNGFLGYFLHVPGGREFIVQVPGAAHSPLDDARLAAVVNWVLEKFSRAQLPADHRPYTAEEVGRLRADSLLDVNSRRAELLRAITELLGVTEEVSGS
jgi:mono/diheme cytochrome c family protein